MTTTNDGSTPPMNSTLNPNPTATTTSTITTTEGTNYDEWSCGMKTALYSQKKFGFLNGVIPRPDEGSPDLEDWWTIQALLVSWIKMSIDPVLRSNISHRDVAKDLWDHLKKRFSVTNGPRVQQIKADLAGCKQRGLTIEAYFGKLTRIWDSMVSYRPLRLCKCECDLGTLQERDREEDKVHQFLFGRDDTLYRTVRSSLVSRIPIQPLEEVYNIVRQEEYLLRNDANSREETTEVSAFAVQAVQSVRRDEHDKHVVCTHFNRIVHSSKSCYGIIGYPKWWGNRPRTRASPSQGRGCGGSHGSMGRGRAMTFANAVQVATPTSSANANYVVTDNDHDKVEVSDAQWRAIKNLLNAGKPNESEKLTSTCFLPFWILDTGASHHLTSRLDILTDVRDMAPVGVVLADDRERILVKEGSSELISLSQLMDENQCVVQLADHFLVVQDRALRTVTGVGKRLGGTFHFRSLEYAASVVIRDEKSFELWHNRMGHPVAKVVGLLPGVSLNNSSTFLNKACDTCLRAKQTRLSFPISENKTTKIFELIHCDLWGPYRTPTYSGARFFLTIVDDYSRGVWIHLLNDKSEAPTQLQNFLAMTTRQFNTPVQKIHSDNGSEFVCLRDFFKSLGIIHETSCVGTPQQNGRAERKHRHILKIARALRTPSSVLQGSTPYERLYKAKPSYAHLRVFGSLCYAHDQSHKGDKFASRSRRCVFMGYPYGKKGWRLYDLEKAQFFVSRDVVFSETEFPYAFVHADEPEEEVDMSPYLTSLFHKEEDANQVGRSQAPNLVGPVTYDPPVIGHVPNPPVIGPVPNPTFIGPLPNPSPLPFPSCDHRDTMATIHQDTRRHTDVPATKTQPSVVASVPMEPERLGRGHRQKTRSVKLKDFVVNTSYNSTTSTDASTSHYPVANYVDCE
ncbi:PREDICTED: uncharacterized protein LOC104753269 [Camelina sativa]|uniref:Uncharacterized protein LOC104753269 n=1 Tax=Camelina sativa TaxID=90675 RepID=A0ABM0WNW0_CAMSA|nr:PREDICTED: uncharacterized protein LOC104753269 [Camelina sativa]